MMDQDACFCASLRRMAHAATEIYDRALEPSGLKITMFRVLRRLSHAGKPSISELARIVELDRSSLGRNLKVLQRQGLVRFSGGDDERSKLVLLTSKGRTALDKALPLWAKAQARMRSVLGRDSEAVFSALAKVDAENVTAA
ncbi:MarR family winged helix-turn-helix transcriptional regulator [Bradyrhizobium prioriisuperbiae]|uniref:MarR family winged helix-turn-helix transcriptional regulator n=1 Tax=Bradyrhizobium prioriisuperbiae TaxID=2854389 RepID=UPI0028E36597|nr:MarR family winged helix-turn-helix transcriptional regulator [Bradyrhizobium prioritasuperba]